MTSIETGSHPELFTNGEAMRPPQAVQAAREILTQGYAEVELGPESILGQEVADIHAEAEAFFEVVHESGLSDERVFRYRTEDDKPAVMSGVRLGALADEYSIDASRPDLCDTIAYMPADLDKLPNPATFYGLPVIQKMLVYRERVMRFAQGVADELAEHYGGDYLDLDPHSFLDEKVYPANRSTQEFRQERHTDDGFLTIGIVDQPGLELLDHNGEVIKKVNPSKNKVIVMPGDVLTNLTGGFLRDAEGNIVEDEHGFGIAYNEDVIAPQRHQVVNYRELPRKGLFAFTSPDVTQVIRPWVETDGNKDINIAAEAALAQVQFGMAALEDPELVPGHR